MNIRRRFVWLVVAQLASFGTAFAQFPAAHVMVLRVGDGTSALTSASAPAFIDEYMAAGGPLVRTIALPPTVSGSNAPFTVSGTSTSEGALSLSTDGRYLVTAGYAAIPSTGAVSTTTSASVNRVVARVDGAGNADVTTRIADGFNSSNVRSAATDDGSRFWVAGNASDASGGVRYVTFGSAGSSLQILTVPNNSRVVEIQAGQLYATSGSSSYTGVFTVGTGLPTQSGQSATLLPGFPATLASPYAFAMDPTQHVCYVADDRTVASGGGIQKWTFDGTTWTLATTFANGFGVGDRGVAVDWSGANPRIFATTAAASANALVTFADDGVGTPVTLAIAPTNTVFRGVAATPATVTAVADGGGAAGVSLARVLPNPAHAAAIAEFSLPRAAHVRLDLFDTQGRRVATLVDADEPAGRFEAPVDLHVLPGGVYLCALRAGGAEATRKLLHL